MILAWLRCFNGKIYLNYFAGVWENVLKKLTVLVRIVYSRNFWHSIIYTQYEDYFI